MLETEKRDKVIDMLQDVVVVVIVNSYELPNVDLRSVARKF
jgi:hypothetical protein